MSFYQHFYISVAPKLQVLSFSAIPVRYVVSTRGFHLSMIAGLAGMFAGSRKYFITLIYDGLFNRCYEAYTVLCPAFCVLTEARFLCIENRLPLQSRYHGQFQQYLKILFRLARLASSSRVHMSYFFSCFGNRIAIEHDR